MTLRILVRQALFEGSLLYALLQARLLNNNIFSWCLPEG
jgi:hypothetical protein